MSKVIQFLETMGRNASSGRVSDAAYAAAVAALDVDAAQTQALLQRDRAALNVLLGGRATQMMMMLFPVEDAPQESEDTQDAPDADEDNASESIRRH